MSNNVAQVDTEARQLLQAFREKVRPFLVEQAVPTVEILDRSAEVLEAILNRKARLSVGFLGEAQVGKSSLINALVGRTALPAGGIGPLTAQATEVTYAEESSLEVTYHSLEELKRVARSIRGHLLKHAPSADADIELPASDDTTLLSAERSSAEPDEDEDEDAAYDDERVSQRMQYILRQADLLLTGEAGTAFKESGLPPATLLSALSLIVGWKARSTLLSESVMERVDRIKTFLGRTEKVREADAGGKQKFDAELKLRAAGWMSPLVSQLTVALPAPLVKDLDLIDLPGIGIVADPAGRIAEDFVASKGDALVLVIRNSGLPTTLARVLEDKGVITKLLFGGESEVPAVHVLVAVTHLDDVAKERYMELEHAAHESGLELPEPDALFSSLAEEMSSTLRRQLREALKASESFKGLDAERAARRAAVVEQIHDTIVVKCVAAPDFNRMNMGLRTQLFLNRAETTNIPALRDSLTELASRTRQAREKAIVQASLDLREGIKRHLNSLQEQHADGQGRAIREWDSFRDELQRVANALKPTMAAFHGEALATLRETIPQIIEVICADAENAANAKLRSLVKKGQGLYWASLNAALTRGGTWEGQDIDYPTTITRNLVDSIATDWDPRVVATIRNLVKTLAERDTSLVEQLCNAAKEHDERIVVDAQIEEQQQILQQHARSCVNWTKERLEELKQDVHMSLVKTVSALIGAACKQAVKAGRNRGSGAKQKILEVFQDAGTAAIQESRKQSARILRTHYQKLVTELASGFLTQHSDPVSAAFEALTNQQLMRARRSDAQTTRVARSTVAGLQKALAL
jgi:hypothetical protein